MAGDLIDHHVMDDDGGPPLPCEHDVIAEAHAKHEAAKRREEHQQRSRDAVQLGRRVGLPMIGGDALEAIHNWSRDFGDEK